MFKKATKTQAKLRLTFDGPAGSGKTYSSLVLGKALGGRTALVDTEHASASKYANLFDFDAASLDEFSLETYIKAIAAAAAAKYDVLIIDSLSHAWNGKGGALETVDRLGGAGGKTAFTSGWRTVTPLHTRLIDSMLAYPGHVIVTMRTKMEYVVEQVNGKNVPRKVGMAPVQREGMEYEFDVVADLDLGGNITVSKTRCPEFSGSGGMLKHEDVAKMGERLKAWLSDGAPVPAAVQLVAVAPPPSSASSTGEQDFDWGTDGAPQSEAARLAVAIAEAQTRADLDVLVPRLKKLDRAAQASLRPTFNKRVQDVANVSSVRQ